MNPRILGNTGIIVSPLGFGTASLMGNIDQAKSMRLLDVAYDHGIRVFDASPYYQDGKAEALLGEFKARHRDVVIITKAGLETAARMKLVNRFVKPVLRPLLRALPGVKQATNHAVQSAQSPPERDFSISSLRRSLDQSRKRLRVDCIDIFLLHECEVDELSRGTIHWLAQMKNEGNIRAAGIATSHIQTQAIISRFGAFQPVVQCVNNADSPIPDKLLNASSLITHSPFGGATSRKNTLAHTDALKASTTKNRHGVVLFSSTSESRIAQNVAAIAEN